jgi:GT2 family glycosyltransferase
MKVDVVMLSYTRDQTHFGLTRDALVSLEASENDHQFNVILVETNKTFHEDGFRYPDFVSVLIPPEEFNYNRFMNIGLREAKSDPVVMSNNDVIFHRHWFSNILEKFRRDPELASASPKCPLLHKEAKYTRPDNLYVGHTRGINVAGWCIVARQRVFERIGNLDESFYYYFQDDDYARCLKDHDLKHALVLDSLVTHKACGSYFLRGPRLSDLEAQRKIFEAKYANQAP